MGDRTQGAEVERLRRIETRVYAAHRDFAHAGNTCPEDDWVTCDERYRNGANDLFADLQALQQHYFLMQDTRVEALVVDHALRALLDRRSENPHTPPGHADDESFGVGR